MDFIAGLSAGFLAGCPAVCGGGIFFGASTGRGTAGRAGRTGGAAGTRGAGLSTLGTAALMRLDGRGGGTSRDKDVVGCGAETFLVFSCFTGVKWSALLFSAMGGASTKTSSRGIGASSSSSSSCGSMPCVSYRGDGARRTPKMSVVVRTGPGSSSDDGGMNEDVDGRLAWCEGGSGKGQSTCARRVSIGSLKSRGRVSIELELEAVGREDSYGFEYECWSGDK